MLTKQYPSHEAIAMVSLLSVFNQFNQVRKSLYDLNAEYRLAWPDYYDFERGIIVHFLINERVK